MDKKIKDIIANQIKTMTEFNAAEMSVTFRRVGYGDGFYDIYISIEKCEDEDEL